MACREGQFDVVELILNYQFKDFTINLNAQNVNGMTHFYLTLQSGKVYVLLLDALEYAHKMQFFEKDGRRYGAVGPFFVWFK